jgi:hypothetical protein
MITGEYYQKVEKSCTGFGNDYQQNIVSRLQLSLASIPSAVNQALLQDPAAVSRAKIGRLSVASIWLPLRVDYYEQAIQFRFWRSVYVDSHANTKYRIFFVIVLFMIIVFSAVFKDVHLSLPLIVTGVWVNIFGATLALVPGEFADHRAWIVGGPQQLKEALAYKSWKRAADLYNEYTPRKIAESLVDQYSNANVIKHKQLNQGQQPLGEPSEPG